MSFKPNDRTLVMVEYFSEWTHGINGDIEIIQSVVNATPETITLTYNALLPWYEFNVVGDKLSIKCKTTEPLAPLIKAIAGAFKPEFIALTNKKNG